MTPEQIKKNKKLKAQQRWKNLVPMSIVPISNSRLSSVAQIQAIQDKTRTQIFDKTTLKIHIFNPLQVCLSAPIALTRNLMAIMTTTVSVFRVKILWGYCAWMGYLLPAGVASSCHSSEGLVWGVVLRSPRRMRVASARPSQGVRRVSRHGGGCGG